jgi:hypothetical protein
MGGVLSWVMNALHVLTISRGALRTGGMACIGSATNQRNERQTGKAGEKQP